MAYANQLVVATTNRGKLAEFRQLLAGLDVQLFSIDDVVRPRPVIVEDGDTFAANAIKKAHAIAHASMLLTVADDSGLEVDALDGKPGVRSARFAHERATDAENNAELLSALEALASRAQHPPPRTARFRCVLALVDPFSNDGEPQIVDGTCEGAIAQSPRGSGGFGYDPLFIVDGTDKTIAELGDAEKNAISHRGRAVAKLRPILEKLLADRAAADVRVSKF
jgi:XTP/dITP diphosphohydrolase